MHILDPLLVDAHLAGLRAPGIDSDACVRSAPLQVLSWDQAYLPGGAFDPDRMLETMQGAADGATGAGHPRVGIMGNMGWAFDDALGSEQLLECESRVNEVLARKRLPAICVYDVTMLSGRIMMDISRSHPLTLIDGVLHEKTFYTPPQLLLPQVNARRASSASRSRAPGAGSTRGVPRPP